MKHLIDLDEDALTRARIYLGTTTIKDTVNEALRRLFENRDARLAHAIDTLAELNDTLTIHDRAEAW
jgi:Arc/MetJ family transcription regulator